jgi:hypothetical protein
MLITPQDFVSKWKRVTARVGRGRESRAGTR